MHFAVTKTCLGLSFFLINLRSTLSQTNTYLEDYCWRDYEGIVTKDALAGGLDRNGRPTYIGQTVFEDKLIPGKIYQNDNNVYFEWYGKEYAVQEHVKILCSQQPQKFQWIRTKVAEFSQLTNKLLIKGGFEGETSTFIGRALHSGETSVGKVICGVSDCMGLFTTSNGKTHLHKTYELLIYNPEIKTVDVGCQQFIDVRSGTSVTSEKIITTRKISHNYPIDYYTR